MNDLRPRLERVRKHLQPPAGSYERFLRYRERKLRWRRVSTGVLVLLIVAGSWALLFPLLPLEEQGPATIGRAPGGEGMARVAGRIDLGGSVQGVAADAAGAWVTEWTGVCQGRLWRIDRETNQATQASSLDLAPDEILPAFDSLWIEGVGCADTSTEGGVIQRLEPDGEGVIATIKTSYPELFGIAMWGEALWFGASSTTGADHVLRVDPETNRIVADIPVGTRVTSVEGGEGGVWAVVGGDEPGVVRIDPATNEVSSRFARGAWDVAVGAGYVWVPVATPPGSATVSVQRLDPLTGEEVGDPILLGDSVFLPFAVDGGGVWFIGGQGQATVAHIDASSLEVDKGVVVAEGHNLEAYLDVSSETIWVADENQGQVIRVDIDQE